MASGQALDEGDNFVSRPAPVFSVKVRDTSKIFAELTDLRETKIFSDFHLKCAGRFFPVHRAIVAANSSYFKRELSACYHDGDTVKCLEVEAEPELLDLLLCFIYKGTVDDVLIELAEALGELADQLGVTELAQQCQQAHLTHLTPAVNNCLSAWSKALSAKDTQMTSKFENLAITHFSTLKDESSFLSLPFSTIMVYLNHEKLNIKDPDERLSAAIKWLRYDVTHRISNFPALLKALPLDKIGRGFLEFLISDGTLGGSPEIQAILTAALGPTKPPIEQVSSQHETIPCTAVMWYNENNISIYPASFDKPVATIDPLNSLCYLGRAACCSDGTDLFVSGVGLGNKEMHCCDVKTRSWRRMNPLTYGRERHCMVVVGGKVLVLGGYNPDTDRFVPEVEEVELPGGVVREEGWLHGSTQHSGCGCCCYWDKDVIVMGSGDESNRTLVQIYCTGSSNTTHVITHPHDIKAATRGVGCVNETLVFAVGSHVYTCPITDVYKDISTGIQRLSHFEIPSSLCLLSLSRDNQQVILVGGTAKHKVYQASVIELLTDSTSGWSPVSVQWDKKVWAYSGAVCTVQLPV